MWGGAASPQWPLAACPHTGQDAEGRVPDGQKVLEERKEELEEVAQELAETEHENTVLRHNIERIKEEKDYTM